MQLYFIACRLMQTGIPVHPVAATSSLAACTWLRDAGTPLDAILTLTRTMLTGLRAVFTGPGSTGTTPGGRDTRPGIVHTPIRTILTSIRAALTWTGIAFTWTGATFTLTGTVLTSTGTVLDIFITIAFVPRIYPYLSNNGYTLRLIARKMAKISPIMNGYILTEGLC